MSRCNPNRWLVVKLTAKETSAVHYRVFGVWYGGYTDGDSWKLNSGITSVTLVDDHYEFNGSSGSVYACHKGSYGTSGYGSDVLNGLTKDSKDITTIEIMPEETDWLTLNYGD